MPLKHDTETLMVLFLGLLIALAGAVVAFLPPVSISVWPWAAAFAVSLVYPLALYPMMKERRADYEFRALHFVPALILLLWLALDLLVTFRPNWQILQSLYTWGWSIGVVAAAFVLLVWFCLRVIRQRVPRLGWLLAIFLPFIILAQLSERQEWDRQLAMTLWDGQGLQSGTGQIAVGGTSSNLDPSSDGAEEQWRAELRRMERRRQRIEEERSSSTVSESPVVAGAKTGTIIASGGLPEKPATVDPDEGTPPPVLPSSGLGLGSLGLFTVAGYCASLHRRTILRRRA